MGDVVVDRVEDGSIIQVAGGGVVVRGIIEWLHLSWKVWKGKQEMFFVLRLQ